MADQSHGNFQENSVQSAAASSGSYCGGASTAVTPIPRLLLTVGEAAWLIGISAFFASLLNDGWKQDHQDSVTYVHQTIDYNNYLPTTYDDYRDWPTISGTQYGEEA